MSMWYSPTRLFSHNALINICMSGRGRGKSYSGKELIIKNFLKDGSQAVYVRRTEVELKKMKDTFWNDICDKYPQHEFKVEGLIGFIDDEPVVYFIPLSTSSQLKSASFPKVKLILFDEYIITKTGQNRYLKNEMTLFLDLLETIMRLRTDVRVLILSNSVSYVNPLFSFFNIEPNPTKRFQKFRKGLICLEQFSSEEFLKAKMETPLAKLIEGTSYFNYAVGNQTLEDNEDFIKPRPSGKSFFVSSFKYEKFEVGVWLNELSHEYYVDKLIDPTNENKYVLVSSEIEPGYRHVKEYRNATWRIKHIKKAYNDGMVYYSNQEVKKFFQNNVMRYI